MRFAALASEVALGADFKASSAMSIIRSNTLLMADGTLYEGQVGANGKRVACQHPLTKSRVGIGIAGGEFPLRRRLPGAARLRWAPSVVDPILQHGM